MKKVRKWILKARYYANRFIKRALDTLEFLELWW